MKNKFTANLTNEDSLDMNYEQWRLPITPSDWPPNPGPNDWPPNPEFPHPYHPNEEYPGLFYNRRGWICPKCGSAISPDITLCPKCSDYQPTFTTTTGTSGTYKN